MDEKNVGGKERCQDWMGEREKRGERGMDGKDRVKDGLSEGRKDGTRERKKERGRQRDRENEKRCNVRNKEGMTERKGRFMDGRKEGKLGDWRRDR